MDIVTIDFETYYDPVFSLSKMTTEAYIRSPQFQVIGVGVKVNNHPTDWYTGESPGTFLKSLDYSNKASCATTLRSMGLSYHGGTAYAQSSGLIHCQWHGHCTTCLWEAASRR